MVCRLLKIKPARGHKCVLFNMEMVPLSYHSKGGNGQKPTKRGIFNCTDSTVESY